FGPCAGFYASDPTKHLILSLIIGSESVAAGRQAASRALAASRMCLGPWRASAVSRPKECSGASRATRWLLGRH
ncbi:hypothetical protein BHE74_00007750, partial [Ensete ventricosum]